MKRLLDMICAGLGLVVLAPVLLLSILAVRLSSPGPVFFRQQRVGRNGRIFEIIKLRTMRLPVAGKVLQITIGKDPRITGAGSLLREWKLDELPQLWNVLAGDMSLVGPRPEVPQYVAFYPPALRDLVLSVRPGITDPCSIHLRNENEILAEVEDPERFYVETLLPEKLRISGDYVRTQSLFSDIGIIVRTLRVVFRKR